MTTVVKIGGNVIDSAKALERFLDDFARMEGPKILVHGGGAVANKMLEDLGIEPNMIDGRRVTDEDTLRIVAGVYAGWVNKKIVAGLQARGCNALGLSGADGDVLRSRRRSPQPIDYGFVGDPEMVGTWFLDALFERGMTPVFCAITHDGQGALLNTNADTVASAVAIAMGARLIYCFEKDGVLNGDGAVIPRLNEAKFEDMRTRGEVFAGMIAKLENVFKALHGGVPEVIIKNSEDLSRPEKGTVCTIC